MEIIIDRLRKMEADFRRTKDIQALVDTIIITTSQDKPDQIERGQTLARELDCRFYWRRQRPLSQFFENLSVQGIVVVESDRLTFQSRVGSKFFYHPSMARHRALNWLRGGVDPMVTAMGLSPGMKVLDCTLGLGSDALITSLAVGELGLAVGLEVSPILSVLVQRGFKEYPWSSIPEIGELLQKAAGRIQVFNLDHCQALKRLDDKSFDVVYFDPMFQQTVWSAKGIAVVRNLGCFNTLEPDTLYEAARVARYRVVVKERKGSQVSARLGLNRVIEGANRISYGVLEVTRERGLGDDIRC